MPPTAQPLACRPVGMILTAVAPPIPQHCSLTNYPAPPHSHFTHRVGLLDYYGSP